jgi:hypothetical protein
MSNDPRDWYTPTTFDDGEQGYWLTREGVIFYAMKTDGKVATDAQVEIARIVAAWYRGEILPRSAAPTVSMLLEFDADAQADAKDSSYPRATPRPPEPVEIFGGVAGLQKLLVKMAEQNRGLEHAALKQLFEAHQLVMAVWQAEDKSGGPGFLTLKGTDYLLAQVRQRGTKKIRATMTAFWCKNKEHAELLQQAFTSLTERGL